VPGFDYSDAMKAANLKWTADKLDAYIANPKAVVPEDKMKFKGLPDAKERGDLIEFLSQQK
jgi:cytochrome c